MSRSLIHSLFVCILAASACSSRISIVSSQPETPVLDTIIEIITIEKDSYEDGHENELIGEELNMAYDGMARYKGTYIVDMKESQSLVIPASSQELKDHIFIVEPEEGVLDYELEFRDSYDDELYEVTEGDTDNPIKFLIFKGPEHLYIYSPVFIVKDIQTESLDSTYNFKIHWYNFDYYDLVSLPDDHRKSLEDQGFRYEETMLNSCSPERTCERTFVIHSNQQYAVEVIGPPAVSDIDISIWCNDPETLLGRSESSPEYRSNICYTNFALSRLRTGEIRFMINKGEPGYLYFPLKIYIFMKDAE